MSGNNERFEAGREHRLALARAAYVERATAQAAELTTLAAQIDEPEALQSLRQLAHRLHGTAGSFGFDRVSLVAAELENILDGGGTVEQARHLAVRLATLIRQLPDA